MAQKKDTKKNVKIGDLAPKKDAKGGRSLDANVGLNRGSTSLNKGGTSVDGGSKNLNAPNQGAF